MDATEPSKWRSRFSPDELQLLQRVECSMSLTADISRADVMLLVQEEDAALVVAQAQPHSIASLYRSPWIDRLLPFNPWTAIQ